MEIRIKLLTLVCATLMITGSASAQSDATKQEDNKETQKAEKFESKTGGFSALMLGKPKETVINLKPQPNKTVELHLFQTASADGNMVAIAGYHDLESEPATEKKIKEVLDGAVAGAVKSSNATATKHEESVLDKNPGRHVEYRAKRLGKDIRGMTRIFLRGKRVYQINYLAAGDSFDSKLGQQIVESLKFRDIEPAKSTNDSKGADKKSADKSAPETARKK